MALTTFRKTAHLIVVADCPPTPQIFRARFACRHVTPQALTPLKHPPTLEVGVGSMEKSFKTSAQLGKNARDIRYLYEDPIIIPHDPEPSDESPPPTDSNALPVFLLVGGSIIALLCAWHLAPDLLERFIKQIIHPSGKFLR